jgi:hypothetical protein
MRTRAWGCGAALLLALGPWVVTAAADQPSGDPPPAVRQRSPSWFETWFSGPKKPDAPAATKDKPALAPPEEPAAVRARERTALLRRQAVCDRLKEIGLRNHDEALISEADDLAQQAWSVYRNRTAQLPQPGPVRPAGGRFDEGPDGAAAPARGGDRNAVGRGTAGEVKP